MRIIRVFFVVLLLLLFICCSSTRVIYRVYEVQNPSSIIDSITLSGTSISDLETFSYIDDDSVRVNAQIGSLYRKGKACGSIKIREENGIKVVSILDQVRTK